MIKQTQKNTKMISVAIDADLLKQVKVELAKRETSMRQVIEGMFKKLVKESQK